MNLWSLRREEEDLYLKEKEKQHQTDQVEGLTNMSFRYLDVDCDGAVDFQEFSDVMTNLNVDIEQKKIKKWFDIMDEDGNGTLRIYCALSEHGTIH